MESSEATQVTNVSPLLDLGVAAKAQAGGVGFGRLFMLGREHKLPRADRVREDDDDGLHEGDTHDSLHWNSCSICGGNQSCGGARQGIGQHLR